MSSRAQTRVQAGTPPAARGLKKNRRDQSARPQLRAVHEQDFAHSAAEDAAYDANRFDISRAETQSRFGHDFSRLSVATSTPAPVPSQLFISQPQDRVEQQAKALARNAMTMPVPQPATESATDTLPQTATAPRRASSVAETDRRESIDTDTQSRLQALSSDGHKLPTAVRDFFEPRLGFDFSRVRIHSDASASELATDLDARAFTLGQHIVFNGDAGGPETAAGRAVLAHELAHVAQQAAHPQMASAQIHRDAAAKPTPAQTVLAKALRSGDDDDTRDLTHQAGWAALEITGDQAARLLINLLDGPTGGDDEDAGLKILDKMVSEKQLDDALEALHNRKYFGQLFDDYSGRQYRALLKTLSSNITHRNVRGWTLDKFLSMSGTNEKEEEAIVVVLEKSPVGDKDALLSTGKRLERLRKTIDKRALAVRFESVVRDVNVQRGDDLKGRLRSLFEVKARRSVAAKQRTQGEVDILLHQATQDLAGELLEYQDALTTAINAKPAKPAEIIKINEKFRKRLNELVDTKSREFDLEIKYNFEFDRLLNEAYSRTWNKQDLQQMDDILAEIPPEILHANPLFKHFSRADRNPLKPNTGGTTALDSHEITLLGDIAPRTVAHEIGHLIHQDKPALLTAFKRLSRWVHLPAGDFAVVIRDEEDRNDLLAKLDEDRQKERKYSRQEYGKYYYRYDKYDMYMYWQYNKNTCFVRDYAETHPDDDFADSFAFYLIDPETLRINCPDKYRFMHIEVFVKYWLEKHTSPILASFDSVTFDALLSLTNKGNYYDQVEARYFTPLRGQLVQDFTTLTQTAEAKAGAALYRILPLKGSTKVEDVGGPYIKQVKDILALTGKVSEQVDAFNEELVFRSLFVPGKRQYTFKEVRDKLMEQFIKDGLALLDPLVERIRKGEHVEKTPWPELQAQSVAYTRAAINAENYLEAYAKAKDLSIQLGATEVFGLDDDALEKVDPTIARKFKRGDKRREPIRQSFIDNSEALSKDMQKLMADIMAQIQTGNPPKKGDKSLDANAIIQTRHKELTAKPKK